MVRIPVFSRLRMVSAAVIISGGGDIMAAHTGLLFWSGFAFGCFGMALLLREVWIIGFHDGVNSVPLDGLGLASGDDREHDSGHRWNPDLGAWEKRT
jgi:hypothetical protein